MVHRENTLIKLEKRIKNSTNLNKTNNNIKKISKIICTNVMGILRC